MNRCQCSHCKVTPHASDCALHNEPALPIGPCDCGAMGDRLAKLEAFFREVAELTVNHYVLVNGDEDSAVVYPSKLGAALERVDPQWWKEAR